MRVRRRAKWIQFAVLCGLAIFALCAGLYWLVRDANRKEDIYWERTIAESLARRPKVDVNKVSWQGDDLIVELKFHSPAEQIDAGLQVESVTCGPTEGRNIRWSLPEIWPDKPHLFRAPFAGVEAAPGARASIKVVIRRQKVRKYSPGWTQDYILPITLPTKPKAPHR